jgi:hypothetical protein
LAGAEELNCIRLFEEDMPAENLALFQGIGPNELGPDVAIAAGPGRYAMRHDPASAAIVIMLRGLKMYGMAQAVSELTELGSPLSLSTAEGRNGRAGGQVNRGIGLVGDIEHAKDLRVLVPRR